MFKFSSLAFLLLLALCGHAQEKDTISVKDAAKEIGFKEKVSNTTKEIGSLFKDTTTLQPPRKAVLRSAILPGWGQARNHKWWKMPLIYGGFFGLGLVYNFNNKYYKDFLAESQFRKANPGTDPSVVYLLPENQNRPDEQIYSAKDFYRRNRDLTLYASIGFYGLQMIDAYIDARLATFDVGDDLSYHIKPSIYIPSYATLGSQAPVPMLTLTIKL